MERPLVGKLLRGLWIAIIIILSFIAIYFVVPLIYPFLIGWLIAYLLNPLVNLLERKGRMSRWLAVSLSILIFISAVAGVITLVVFRIVNEIQRLSIFINDNYDQWLTDLSSLISSGVIQHWIDEITNFYRQIGDPDTVDIGVNSVGSKIVEAVTSILQQFAQYMVTFITALPNVAVGLIIAFIATFFISKDWYRIRRWSGNLMHNQVKDSIEAIWIDLRKALFGFLKAQFILISITACFVIIGLVLLRVDYAVSIGLLIGLVDLMPYLGTGAVFIPWIIIILVKGNYAFAIGLSVLYGIILIARQLAEPKVLSSSIGLNPLVTLIGVFVGLKLFGVLGLIIGPIGLVLGFAFHRADVFRDIRRYIVHGHYFQKIDNPEEQPNL
ncbi:MAG: sporulation integral membrane protein YtvI [Paenibacillaceae bacterium]